MSHRIPSVFIAPSDLHGTGVFAGEDIDKESIIEICPIIFLPEEQLALIKKTVLNNYYFEWGKDLRSGALALGYGSIYNHSVESNAIYEVDINADTISFYTIRDIIAGEEITINYNGTLDNKDKVWFEV
ncbi:MAG: SET domain-containing protein [Saprospiraceae bacterium]|nr:SET domain-containing protein [Saprospiraceae bacterium]